MAKRTIHIVPSRNGGWAIKYEGAGKASKVVSTKVQAQKIVAQLAARNGAQVVVHGQDGKIISSRTIEAGDEDDCFITTACVKYYKLPDDCSQLSTLREFRDEYLLKSIQGKALVDQYYLLAPDIVSSLNRNPNKKVLYKNIFAKINRACVLIKEGKLEEAKCVYIAAIEHLVTGSELQ